MEVEAAQSRQADIEHEAARRIRKLVQQKFRHRGEQLWLKIDRSKQAAQRFMEGGVVIDDEDD
jgi:hypothetical protein